MVLITAFLVLKVVGIPLVVLTMMAVLQRIEKNASLGDRPGGLSIQLTDCRQVPKQNTKPRAERVMAASQVAAAQLP